MQGHTLAYEDIIPIPEFHAEKMHIMPTMAEPGCNFPDTFFHTTFYIRVDNIVDKSDLH
jgi:hypothetical protein